MIEQWRDVPGFEGRYQVSDQGRVKTFCRHAEGRIMHPTLLSSGYLQACLTSPNGAQVRYRLHRLVALVFIPNPDNLPEVDHLDCDKQNCAAANLEWVTSQENMRRAAQNGLMLRGEKNHKARLTAADVSVIRGDALAGVGVRALAARYGVHRNTIGLILSGRNGSHV
jgi:hypothetical protein